jgi:hypothetical protein
MKTALTTLLATLPTATAALAATGPRAEGMGLLTWLFLGFGALIVVGQCVPALVLFAAMVRSLFAGAQASKAPPAR